jgi:hypothetical protein
MKISDEAVEATAKAIHEAGDWDVPWTGDDWRADCARTEARAALEAATPHLMAQVWEEGRLGGHAEEQSGFENAMNPYRSAGAGE